jgi:hypothetical protein
MIEYVVRLPLEASFNLNEEDNRLFFNVSVGDDYLDQYEHEMSKAQLNNVIQHLQVIKEKMI